MQSKFIWFIGTVFLAAVVVFNRLGALPIEVWDEARLANNALEMSQTGLSLITTYGGLTDYWNTKPPMLIWLMSISISLFGANEWAVRLPSALSAMATVIIVFAFCVYQLKRPLVGFFSIALLLLTSGYVQFHGARAGDYDSMLTLWTTGYLISGYMYFHAEACDKIKWFSLCVLCVVLAFFTKTIQGFIFLPGLFIYALSKKKLFTILRSPELYLGIIFILLSCVGYYLLRENVDPGYFSYAKANDLLGRYNNALESAPTKPYLYLLLKEYPFTVLAIVLLAYQCLKTQNITCQVSIYLGLISFSYLAIISASATKHAWYLDPICPLVAMIVAISINQAFEWIVNKYNYLKQTLLISISLLAIILGLGVIAANSSQLLAHQNSMKADKLDQYNFFIRSPFLQSNSFNKFVIIHPGYHNNFQPEVPYYAPLLFYVNSLRASGKTILIQPPALNIPNDYNIAVLCGDDIYRAVNLKVNLKAIKTDSNCGVYAVSTKQ